MFIELDMCVVEQGPHYQCYRNSVGFIQDLKQHNVAIYFITTALIMCLSFKFFSY